MNYELAKQLKDADFPQNISNIYGIWFKEDKEEPIKFGEGIIFNKCIYAPTLEELIDACGDAFCSLTHWYTDIENIKQSTDWDEWTAFANTPSDSMVSAGKTKKEAIANLWLILNKKK